MTDPSQLGAAGKLFFEVVKSVTRSLTFFIQRDSYLFWPFIVSTLAIVIVFTFVAAAPADGQTRGQRLRSYFSARLWWHRSSRTDYKLYLGNALLFPLLLAPIIFSQAAMLSTVSSWLGTSAPGPATLAGDIALRVTFTVVFFIVYDLGRFIGHTLLHDIPFLWPFHKVHHAAQVLTPFTSFRIHPVEILIMAWVPGLLTGLLTWAFNRFAGANISVYTFLGLHVVIWVFSLIDNLRHSPVWISYGKGAGRWLVSPAHHQLHHSIESRHWGKRGGCNRGSDLAIWDRLYGTLYVPGHEPETFRMGLEEGEDEQWQSLWRSYLVPFRESAQAITGARTPARRGMTADNEPQA